jgi:hypothetical protein
MPAVSGLLQVIKEESMKRNGILSSLLFMSLLLSNAWAKAEVKIEEKSLAKFEGIMGTMMGLFGGKAAKEGIIDTVAVRGNRKATMNDSTGTIIDLSEEKIYNLDMKKKTYEVVTFEEERRRILDAQGKAAKAAKEQKTESPKQGQEMEMDFDLKESGQKKVINDFDCREVIMTMTMRQKGKKLEEGGGMVMTSNIWLGPEIPAFKEIAEFDMRYFQKLNLGAGYGAGMEQMAAAMAMYPGMKEMMTKFQSQQVDMKGTQVLTVTKMESVMTAEQQAASEKKQQEDTSSGGGIGGLTSVRSLGGLLGRKAAAPKKEEQSAGPKDRAAIMTMNHELLKVATSVSQSDTAIPPGFKEKK